MLDDQDVLTVVSFLLMVATLVFFGWCAHAKYASSKLQPQHICTEVITDE